MSGGISSAEVEQGALLRANLLLDDLLRAMQRLTVETRDVDALCFLERLGRFGRLPSAVLEGIEGASEALALAHRALSEDPAPIVEAALQAAAPSALAEAATRIATGSDSLSPEQDPVLWGMDVLGAAELAEHLSAGARSKLESAVMDALACITLAPARFLGLAHLAADRAEFEVAPDPETSLVGVVLDAFSRVALAAAVPLRSGLSLRGAQLAAIVLDRRPAPQPRATPAYVSMRDYVEPARWQTGSILPAPPRGNRVARGTGWAATVEATPSGPHLVVYSDPGFAPEVRCTVDGEVVEPLSSSEEQVRFALPAGQIELSVGDDHVSLQVDP